MYIPGVPLRGQKPGLMLDFVVKSHSLDTPKFNIEWDEQELKLAVMFFKKELESYVSSQEFKEEFLGEIQISIE